MIAYHDECEPEVGTTTMISETGESLEISAQDNELCQMFARIHSAGAVYIVFNVLSMITLLVFLILTGMKICNRDGAIERLCKFTVVVISVSLLLQVIGFSVYLGATRVKMRGS